MTTQTKTTWRKVKLGEVLKIRRGASPRPIHDFIRTSGMPWLKIADITGSDSRFVDSTKEFIKQEGVSKSVVVKPGDLVLSNSATPGIPRFMRITACVHDGWLILEPINNSIDKQFLYYRLIIDRRQLVSNVTGAIFDNLKTDVIREHQILLPPLTDQKRIADILSAFDDKIELNNKISRTLEQMAQAIFKEWFIENSKFKNQNAKLEEIAKIIKGKKPQKVYAKSQGEDIEYLLIESFITNNQFFTDDKKVPQSGDWDTIIVMDGASSGRIFRGRVGAVGSTLAVIKPKPEVSREFLFLLLKQAELQLMGNLTGSAIPHLDKDFLKTYPVSIPASGEMEKFTIVVRPMLQKMVETENENQKLAALRDLLLPKLMSGDIRV